MFLETQVRGIQSLKIIVELQSGYEIKKWRSDRGEKYTSQEFQSFREDLDLERQLLVA